MDRSVEDPLELRVDEFSDDEGEVDHDDEGAGLVDADADDDDDDVAGDRADLEVITHPTVSDNRYVADAQDPGDYQDHDQHDQQDQHDQDEEDDALGDDNTAYPDVIPVVLPHAGETYNRRSAWSRAVVPVLAIAVVVGGIAYFLGLAFAPNDGPTDQVLETQSALNTTEASATAATADPVDRELSDALVGAGTGSPPVNAAGGAPARSSTPIIAGTPSETAMPVAADPETPPVSTAPVGSREVEQPRTRTVEAASTGATAAPVVPETIPGTGWVLVRTEPPGATVTLDGIGRGQTPLSLRDVSFGTHRLEVSRPGFDTVRRDVTVDEQNTVVPVGVSLTPAGGLPVAAGSATEVGSLAIRSRPPGARVMVDGTPAGVTPLDVTLPVGRHQVRIEGDGYQAWVTSVEVLASEPAQVNASLESPAR